MGNHPIALPELADTTLQQMRAYDNQPEAQPGPKLLFQKTR